MALTVEDGTIVSGADSYVGRSDFIDYAATKGVTIADEAATDHLLVKAAQFIDAHELRLKGVKTTRDQPLSFPRSDLILEGFTWDSNEIPSQVILCQQEVALDLNDGVDIWNPGQSESQGVKRERVEGAVEVEYAIHDSMRVSRRSLSKAMLNILLKNSGMLTIGVSMG